MYRTLLKSKIHRVRVTEANLNYEGSLTIDRNLMDAADIVDFEEVDVYDITTGSRLSTYAIPGESGSGTICVNGAAAHLVKPNDLIIIATYSQYAEAEIAVHRPRIVLVDEKNQIRVEKSAPVAS